MKIAAKNFVDVYGDASAARWVSVVSFGSDAEVVSDWTNVSTDAGAVAAKNAIDRISIGGGTNLDHGLQIAGQQLESETIRDIPAPAGGNAGSRFIIALTDGVPTYYYNGSRQGNGGEGKSNVEICSKAAIETADSLKSDINTLYTICFAGGADTKEVLKEIASSEEDAYTADTASGLSFIVSDLGSTINQGTNGEGLVVTDPMAAFVSVTGNLPNGFVQKGHSSTYEWTLEDAKQEGEIYTYTLTYQIEIDADDPDFEEDTFYPTNGVTYLTYGEDTVYFPVPGIKGVKTDYTVTYYDEDGSTQLGTGTYHYGEDVTVPADPTKAADATNTYTFDKWVLVSGPALSDGKCQGNAVYKASYVSEKINYTVTYYDEDGSTQLGTGTYHYGEDVTVPADPTKAADATNTYTFDKWVLVSGPALSDGKCQGNAVYKASYSVIPREAQLSVTSKVMKTAGEIKAGDTITWTITVSNSGNKDAAVTASMIADKIYYRDNDNSAWTELTGTGSDVTFPSSLPVTVEAGKSIDIDVTWVVPDSMAGKWIKNAAKVNDSKDPGAETEPVFVVPTPGLSVTKTVNKTSVTVGDTVKYTITVKNTGNVDLTNVNVAEAFGGDLSKIFDLTGATKASPFNGFVIGELKAGATAEITFSYKTTTRGTLTNSVEVSARNPANLDGGTVTDSAASPDVTVKSEPITPVGPSKPQLNYEDHYAYVVGYPDGLVHPERNITRAEVATIFFRMLLDESREYFWAQENDFSDVAETDWFNNAVSTLANAQLINGYPDGSYRPNANITRAEFATIAIRFFLDEDVEIEENNLSDVKGHWAEANINLAYALELINGYPDGTFRPDQKITRAEAMAIVNRVLKRAPEKDHLLKDMIEWPDNLNTAAWYYADVQEATNSHKFHMDKEEEYEIWTELLPVRDWVALEQEWSKANSSKNPGEVVDIKITTPEADDNGLKLD